MANYVPVHGDNLSSDSWNKLRKRNDYSPRGHLGGKAWDTIVPTLHASHHTVFAPTLKDEYDYTLSNHIEQISGSG